jgi:predicted nuclease of predicted toxin-antitoxin system
LRLLVDQNLPRRLAWLLHADGRDAVHTEDVGMATTGDPAILVWCCSQDRVLVTADKKLTKYLASSGADCPSVLILREMRTEPADQVAAILIANLPQIEQVIKDHGNAVFSLALTKPIRAELLPLGVPDKSV